MKPYTNRPDVFELVADKSMILQLCVKHIDFAVGKSREEYCYFEDVLIGMLSGEASRSKKYYEGLNVPFINRMVIKLTPNISKNEYITCPSLEEFNAALKSLISKHQGFTLICEADCEQNEIEEDVNIDIAFEKVREFCNGKTYECPTFVQRNEM